MAEKIILDTCTFFSMLPFCKTYKQVGIEKLKQDIKEYEEQKEKTKNSLKQLMSDDFLLKHKDKPFEQQVDLLKEYINTNISNVEKKLPNLISMSEGYVINKNKVRQEINLSEENKQEIKQKINDINLALIEMRNVDATYNSLRKDYKDLCVLNDGGHVFEMYANEQVDFYITAHALEEILNHTKSYTTYNGSDDKYVIFDDNVIKPLLNECTLITFTSKKAIKCLDTISQKYRTKQNSCDSSMKNDINSVNKYGDSMIMAEASLAGINLITFNAKDFIYYCSI